MQYAKCSCCVFRSIKIHSIVVSNSQKTMGDFSVFDRRRRRRCRRRGGGRCCCQSRVPTLVNWVLELSE